MGWKYLSQRNKDKYDILLNRKLEIFLKIYNELKKKTLEKTRTFKSKPNLWLGNGGSLKKS